MFHSYKIFPNFDLKHATLHGDWPLLLDDRWHTFVFLFFFFDIPNCGNQFSVNTMYQVSELTVWPVLFIAEILFAIEFCDYTKHKRLFYL